jgi:ubiquinone/menaquinone biosynthesis C-methylase UbiE
MDCKKYVQYGSHFCAPENWRNFDASPTLLFERIPMIGRLYTKNDSRFPSNVEYGDIVKGLPISNESCEAVYCSHTLEHLSLEDLRVALQNTYKILKKGGTFRLVLPDLEYEIQKYINDKSPTASINLLKELSLGKERRPKGIIGFLSEWLGNSNHLWMWDFKSLEAELKIQNFTHIRKAYFGDSSEPFFADVENIERWTNCLGIECKK